MQSLIIRHSERHIVTVEPVAGRRWFIILILLPVILLPLRAFASASLRRRAV
jgi:hypothetical protein